MEDEIDKENYVSKSSLKTKKSFKALNFQEKETSLNNQNINLRSSNILTSTSPEKSKKRVKKMVSFKDDERRFLKRTNTDNKLFYRSNTFEQSFQLKSIMKLKRTQSMKSKNSLKSTKSSTTFSVTESAGNFYFQSSKLKKVGFKDPEKEVKKIESVSKFFRKIDYKKTKKKLNEKNEKEKVDCTCSKACLIF